jgi:hypothetical protein
VSQPLTPHSKYILPYFLPIQLRGQACIGVFHYHYDPSTINPMAMANPPKGIKLAEIPNLFIAMKVRSGVKINVATTIKDERTSPEE